MKNKTDRLAMKDRKSVFLYRHTPLCPAYICLLYTSYEYFGDVRTVDVTVRRLREKIEDDPGKPAYILTKRGVGYYFDCD